jgi:hypothetical protein
MCKCKPSPFDVFLFLTVHSFEALIKVPLMHSVSIQHQPEDSHALIDHPAITIEEKQIQELMKDTNQIVWMHLIVDPRLLYQAE